MRGAWQSGLLASPWQCCKGREDVSFFFSSFLPSSIRPHLILTEGSLQGPQPLSSFLCQHTVHQMLQLPAGWNPGVWEAPSEWQPILFYRAEKLYRWKRLELNAWYSQASVELLAACLLYYFSVKISSYWWWHLSSGGERGRKAVTVHPFNFCANASSFLPKVLNFTPTGNKSV